MGRTFAAIALVVALLIGGGVIATTAYQVGVSTAVTTAVNETGATVVTPVLPGFGYAAYPGYGYGPGWGGPGFSIFGFLGTLLFVFLIIGLLRAVFFRGSRRGWGRPGGRGGPGAWGGPGSHGYDRWQGRAREVFDDLHREAHKPETDTKPPTS
jgi:hypothetical protein